MSAHPGPFGFDDYLSPFTWRYGSPAMRHLWSEAHKRRLWRRVWVALATAQHELGLVAAEEVADLAAHVEDVDVPATLARELTLRHDLVAELHTFAAQCPRGGRILHLGATSTDIEDNADALRLRDSLLLLREGLRALLAVVAAVVERWAELPAMGFTHLQPAEPTTVGYRLAQTGQDLLSDWRDLERIRVTLRGKGFKGAVGTSAAYAQLVEGTGYDAAALEERAMDHLGLAAWPVATQTAPRKQEYALLAALAGLGQTLYKLAFDLRLLQSPMFGEWAEPFAPEQVGSSAMPFKRNPVDAENVCSLARLLAALPRVAWDDAAHSLLERTLDDSANRRTVLPEAFLAADEIVSRTTRILGGLRVDANAVARTLARFGPFAATERLLVEAVRRGGDRQVLHAAIRRACLAAWEALESGDAAAPRLLEHLAADPAVSSLVPADDLVRLLDASGHLGRAPEAARTLAASLRQALAQGESR